MRLAFQDDTSLRVQIPTIISAGGGEHKRDGLLSVDTDSVYTY